MNTKRREILNSFLKRVDDLFNNINNWLKSSYLKSRREEIEVTEEASGKYKTNKLIIEDKNGKNIACAVPIGAWVIGAEGRVDLVGYLDRVIISYLREGGPSLITSVSVGGEEESGHRKRLYHGIEKEGWYWIEDRRRGKAHLLTKDIFLELLIRVADYGIE